MERPRPRIVTTIFDGGQVVHKIVNRWQNNLETEQDRQELESKILEQHKNTITQLETEGIPPPARQNLAGGEGSKSTESLTLIGRNPNESITKTKPDPEGCLQQTAGLLGIIVASYSGTILSNESLPNRKETTESVKQWSPLVNELAVFVRQVSQTTRLGQFVEGIIDQPYGKIILTGGTDTVIGIVVDRKTDIQQAKDRLRLAMSQTQSNKSPI